MKKLMASLLVSGLVISGVGIYHVEAASGNTSQTRTINAWTKI